MLPLRDEIPSRYAPLVTWALIGANVAAFGCVAGVPLCGLFARRGREQLPGPARHYVLPQTVARHRRAIDWS